MVHNDFGFYVRAGFLAQNCQTVLNLNRSTKLRNCMSQPSGIKSVSAVVIIIFKCYFIRIKSFKVLLLVEMKFQNFSYLIICPNELVVFFGNFNFVTTTTIVSTFCTTIDNDFFVSQFFPIIFNSGVKVMFIQVLWKIIYNLLLCNRF